MKRFHTATLGETLCRVRNCKSPMSWTRCSLLTTDFLPSLVPVSHLMLVFRLEPEGSYGIVGKHERAGNSQETSASYVRSKMDWIFRSFPNLPWTITCLGFRWSAEVRCQSFACSLTWTPYCSFANAAPLIRVARLRLLEKAERMSLLLFSTAFFALVRRFFSRR